MKTLLTAFALSLLFSPAFAKDVSPDNLLLIDLKSGQVQIEMLPEIAPNHVAQVKALASQGFYNNLEWFRVIEGFVAQTGYPKGSKGKSKLPDLKAEFSDYKFRRGTVGMGHGDDINSANSQFFICLSNAQCADLTGKYTAWGQVISGMEHVDEIAVGTPPARPDKVTKLRLASDGSTPARKARSAGNQ